MYPAKEDNTEPQHLYSVTIVMKLECEGVVKNGNITYDLHQILCSVVGTVEP